MLKIEKQIAYLSPSSLMKHRKQPNKYYLENCCYDAIREPQGLPAAIGSAFDYLVKENLFKTKLQHKIDMLPDMKKKVETDHTTAWVTGRLIYNTYSLRCQTFQDWVDAEMDITKKIGDIPIRGLPDATVKDAPTQMIVPFDWKVGGFGSASGQSPKPKYFRRIDHGVEIKACHKDYEKNMPMEDIDLNWAIQTCTYGWLLGYLVGEEFPALVDQITRGANGKIAVTSYRGIITHEFQQQVYDMYASLWKRIIKDTVHRTLASSNSIGLVWMAAQEETFF